MPLMPDPDRAPLEAVETRGPKQVMVIGLKVCPVKVLEFVANLFSSPIVTLYHLPTCVTFFLRLLSKIWLGTSAYLKTFQSQL